jgi:hypothetical protein
MDAPKIEIKREHNKGGDHAIEANVQIQNAALSLHPEGTKYKGSLACHIYEINGKLDMIVKSQIAVDQDVSSPQAWIAMKELIQAARDYYGHAEKEIDAEKIATLT